MATREVRTVEPPSLVHLTTNLVDLTPLSPCPEYHKFSVTTACTCHRTQLVRVVDRADNEDGCKEVFPTPFD